MTTASSSTEARLRHRFIRRWRLGVVGIIATIGLCFAAMNLFGPSYTAQAYILLTPPPTTGSNGSPNPYMTLGGMQPLTDVMARAMVSDSTLTQLRQAGLSGTYTVARDTATNGPLLDVKTTASSGAAALKDLSLVVATAQPELNSLQGGESIPAKDRVTPKVVSKDTVASASHKTQIRALVVVGVAGLLLTGLGVCVLDIVLLRRRDRGRRAPAPDGVLAEPAASELPAAESDTDLSIWADGDEAPVPASSNGHAAARAEASSPEPADEPDGAVAGSGIPVEDADSTVVATSR